MILGIDPGTYASGWALYEPVSKRVVTAGELGNQQLEERLVEIPRAVDQSCPFWCTSQIAIEMIGHYGTGMSVGAETYHTVLWIGRWTKACEFVGLPVALLRRPSIKAELCGVTRAKDAEVAQALRDLLGERGTKKNPGPTYGVSSHAWQALAVAVAYSRGVQPLDWRKKP